MDRPYCYDFSDLMRMLFLLSVHHYLLSQCNNVILTIMIELCGSQFNRGSLSDLRTYLRGTLSQQLNTPLQISG